MLFTSIMNAEDVSINLHSIQILINIRSNEQVETVYKIYIFWPQTYTGQRLS